MKNKGFTLVELLAMLVVLALLMAVAIPNISGILRNQRLNIIRNDARTMVETAKIKVAKNESITKPTQGQAIVFSLDYLNDNDNIETGPNGGKYNKYESFVVYARIGSQYKYYVRLVEEVKSPSEYKYGIELDDIDNINEKNNDNIKKITDNIGLTKQSQSVAAIKSYFNSKKAKLNGVQLSKVDKYYLTNSKYYCKYDNNEYYNAAGEKISSGAYYDNDGNVVATLDECLASGCEECK